MKLKTFNEFQEKSLMKEIEYLRPLISMLIVRKEMAEKELKDLSQFLITKNRNK